MFYSDFKNYLNTVSSGGPISEKIPISGSKLSYHIMELERFIIDRCAKDFIKRVHKYAGHAKRKCRVDLDNPVCPHEATVEELLRSWGQLYNFNLDPNSLFIREALKMERVSVDEFYAHIYNQVLNGERGKRQFRIHFNDSYLPITLVNNGVVRSVDIQLQSISSSHLLFSIKERVKDEILNSSSCYISFCLSELFECSDKRLVQEIPVLTHSDEVQELLGPHKKSQSFRVDTSLVTFHQHQIDSYKLSTSKSLQDEYLHIPFEALSEDILMAGRPKYIEKELKRKIDQLEDSIYGLIA